MLALDTNEFGVKTSGGDMLWTATLDPQTGKLQQTDGLATLDAAGNLQQQGGLATTADIAALQQLINGLPQIERGVIQAADNPDVIQQLPITFSQPFSSAPTVLANPQTTVPDKVVCTVSGITKTGGNIYFKRTSASTTGIQWIAIGYR